MRFPWSDRRTAHEGAPADAIYVDPAVNRPVMDPVANQARIDQARAEGRLEAERKLLDAERDGYRQGLRERAVKKRGNPLLALLLVLVLIGAGVILYLVYREGSFAGAGNVLDREAAAAAQSSREAAGAAVADTGQAIQNAGRELEAAGSDASN